MFKKVKTKLNNSEKKIPDATTLIRINQYNIDKQNLEKKWEILIKKIPDTSVLMTTNILDTKIGEVENNIPVIGLAKKTDYDARIKDIEENILLLLIIINLQVKHLMQK